MKNLKVVVIAMVTMLLLGSTVVNAQGRHHHRHWHRHRLRHHRR